MKRKKTPIEFAVGAKVDYHGIIDGPVTVPGCIVMSESWEMCGTQVTKVDKVRGAVAVESLSLSPDAEGDLIVPEGCDFRDYTEKSSGAPAHTEGGVA